MSSDLQRQMHRREFFRAAARYGSLAAMGVAAYLTRRRPGQSCINSSICRGCAAFRDCGLPAALSAKVAQSKPVAADVRRLSL
jgi:hypothetical protein